MKKIRVRRLWKFRSVLLPFWIVFGIDKSQFMKLFHLQDDLTCELDVAFPITRLGEVNLTEYGVPIYSGRTLTIVSDRNISSLFVMTCDGLLSNEVNFDNEAERCEVEISVAGGWRTPSYPIVRLL